MSTPSLTSFGPEQAAAYDERFAKFAPLRDALHLLAGTVLARLPEDARILCVGAGTGAELLALGSRFPGWRFTAVEPSGAMLDRCRLKAEMAGMAERCEFHTGYLDSLPEGEPYHAATSILVSQFVLDEEMRRGFFREIAGRVMPGGYLLNADLSTDLASPLSAELFEVWLRLFEYADFTPEAIEGLRTAYGTDVAITPPEKIEAIIASAGFGTPTAFLQTGLIRAWFATRGAD
ncbi:class I SAM-dependent methyltransferase [Luteolibacter flavescens]|uniref:Class I SAM-dependent methyltransferase n=1 Tax=Luteolibacter flavescens TaxID=1859460 RepID=A0ABT3FMI3_9BACT|nr:class I SAM-dependent methyltransferase [Luteolibacter flavescens]MCW1884404.1 class I SAM-dependent methyltransferase [Luteolibacter flavescens]